MKKTISYLSLFLLFLLVLSFSSCEDKVVTTKTFTAYSPVYMSYDDLRSAVKISTKEEIPELKPIKDIAIGIAINSIVEVSKESRQVRKKMAENLNLPWQEYLKVEVQALKIIHEREN